MTKKIKEAFELIDVEPLILRYDDYTWVHPYIQSWYLPDDITAKDVGLYKIYLMSTTGKQLKVNFKSNYINLKIIEWHYYCNTLNPKQIDIQDIFKHPFIDVRSVFTKICYTLSTNTWKPSIYVNYDISDTVMRKQIKKRHTGGLFNESSFGKEIMNFFIEGVELELFSLDSDIYTAQNKILV